MHELFVKLSARPVGLNTPSHSRYALQSQIAPITPCFGLFASQKTIINRFFSRTTNCATPRFISLSPESLIHYNTCFDKSQDVFWNLLICLKKIAAILSYLPKSRVCFLGFCMGLLFLP
jgi:hypothetical protein